MVVKNIFFFKMKDIVFWDGNVVCSVRNMITFRIYLLPDGRIVLRWIFRKWDVGVWTGLSWLRIKTVGGHL
jgi:hypothetical protein